MQSDILKATHFLLELFPMHTFIPNAIRKRNLQNRNGIVENYNKGVIQTKYSIIFTALDIRLTSFFLNLNLLDTTG